jgi:hypothetical protein
MRPGLFPSQQRALQKALKKAEKFDHFRQRTRRTFCLLLVGAAAATVGSFYAGQVVGRRVSPRAGHAEETDRAAFLRQQLPLAHRLARSTDRELEAGYATFLLVMSGTGGDDVLWHGYERLGALALARADERGREIADGLVRAASMLTVPERLQPLLARLRAHREWK